MNILYCIYFFPAPKRDFLTEFERLLPKEKLSSPSTTYFSLGPLPTQKEVTSGFLIIRWYWKYFFFYSRQQFSHRNTLPSQSSCNQKRIKIPMNVTFFDAETKVNHKNPLHRYEWLPKDFGTHRTEWKVQTKAHQTDQPSTVSVHPWNSHSIKNYNSKWSKTIVPNLCLWQGISSKGQRGLKN